MLQPRRLPARSPAAYPPRAATHTHTPDQQLHSAAAACQRPTTMSSFEKRHAVPATAASTRVVELSGPGEWIRCIVQLPGGDRVATTSRKVRVFAVARPARWSMSSTRMMGVLGGAL
jgi:hypothetical protein